MEKQLSVRRSYEPPTLRFWGGVADLTKTGLTVSGADAKGGSVLHSNGR